MESPSMNNATEVSLAPMGASVSSAPAKPLAASIAACMCGMTHFGHALNVPMLLIGRSSGDSGEPIKVALYCTQQKYWLMAPSAA